MNQPDSKIPDLRGLQENVPETLHPVLNWMGRNHKLLIGIVSVIILVVAGFSIFKVVTGHQAESARNELTDILFSNDPGEMDRLAAFAEDAPEAVAVRARFELAAAKLGEKDYAGAAEAFAELARSEDKDVHVLATMSQARCLLLDDKADQALALMDDLKTSVPEAYSGSVTRLYAVAAEAAGKTDLAVSAYQELLAKGQGVDTEFLLYKLNQLSDASQSGSQQ